MALTSWFTATHHQGPRGARVVRQWVEAGLRWDLCPDPTHQQDGCFGPADLVEHGGHTGRLAGLIALGRRQSPAGPRQRDPGLPSSQRSARQRVGYRVGMTPVPSVSTHKHGDVLQYGLWGEGREHPGLGGLTKFPCVLKEPENMSNVGRHSR